MAKCKKEIADKVKRFVKIKSEAENLYKEIKDYFVEELKADDWGFQMPFLTDKPKGNLQNDDEYCDQIQQGDDWFTGTYYHEIEGEPGKYVGYSFDI